VRNGEADPWYPGQGKTAIYLRVTYAVKEF
jgi:hypothetical protein